MSSHIVLTSHPLGRSAGQSPAIRWGAATAAERGPVVASLTNPAQRNAIGTHSGAYALYRALEAVDCGARGMQMRGERQEEIDPVLEPSGVHRLMHVGASIRFVEAIVGQLLLPA